MKVLAVGLAPFVEQRMRLARGDQWLDSLSPNSANALGDPRFVLKVMTLEWDAFSPPLSRMERSFAFELRETGNRVAHYEPFKSGDVDRAIDSAERLLVAALAAVDIKEAPTVRQAIAQLPRGHGVDEGKDTGDHRKTSSGTGKSPGGEVREPVPPESHQRGSELANGTQNWRLILAAACALTFAGQTPFTRIGVYEWIWDRYPRSEHDRPSLDPTFQGMVIGATGGPKSAGGTPLRRIDRGLYELADPTACQGSRDVVDAHAKPWSSETAWPGHPVTAAELAGAGFRPLELRVARDVDLPGGRGCDWTTIGEVPDGPGLYAFSAEDDHEMRVAYVGRTEHLWMVTKGCLPGGQARPGQRYGRPRYAGTTRQRINLLVAEQLRAGRLVRHWVRPCPAAALRLEEERLISQWDLRRVGWNRG